MSEKVMSFISSHWDECIKVNMEDEGTLIGLPYPYTVPTVGHFDELYYWDTYFTNKGLMLEGRFDCAKYNVDNMLCLISRYGFMPNGNRTYYLKNSQPPFLSEMVRDVYEHYKDKAWLFGAYHMLEREYDFWMTKRITPTGLNRYDCTFDRADAESLAESYAKRTKYMPDKSPEEVARHYLTICESGWDVNPRWESSGYDFAPADLNSLMYLFEKNMMFFESELGLSNGDVWEKRANERADGMRKYMKTSSGVFLDHNFAEGTLSKVFSAASFYPMFAGMANPEEAAAAAAELKRLETEFGITACEKNNTEGMYQWDYPNGWACLQYIVVMALDKYGYEADAKRIAKKYIMLVDRVFEKTGNLWEKYNVVDGSIKVTQEGAYAMPSMMGWSAGVYLALNEYIGRTK